MAFVDRDGPAKQWWKAFRVHLTPSAIVAFEGTDPRVIPATEVTDSGRVSSYPDGTSASVLVDTDAGQYQVGLVRESLEHPWMVDRIAPPESR